MQKEFRKELLEKLNVDENQAEELKKISNCVRKESHLTKKEKCYCAVCGRKGNNANHHVMKVEYISIIASAYDLCEDRPCRFKNDTPGKVRFKQGIDMCYPRVSVCPEHHQIFHELIGDIELDKVKNIDYQESEKIINTISNLDKDVENWYGNDDKEDIPAYKRTYKKIWDSIMMASLIKLGVVLENRSHLVEEQDSIDDITELVQSVTQNLDHAEITDEILDQIHQAEIQMIVDDILEDF